ncbi:hypothetical protein SBF1_1110039 [Candidatus Desulfosporosinus infrequens]|uniref:Histidine kinase domain-containing protein n=1 Tax=Candidatus Desulfosporosinus infrequens TaxID=2043169 RepID=A0A2U3JYF5_9FIRM|nr:hypothetical protein SBF1_1110039 [Candidatus Desulfosporosinus infrequens]
MLTIINDILDLSKIEAGKVILSREKFDINILVNEVDKLIKSLAVRKELKYQSYIDKELGGQLVGDPGRLKQILFNLLGNAIKFTEHGSIELSITKGKALRNGIKTKLFCIYICEDEKTFCSNFKRRTGKAVDTLLYR